MRRWHDTIAVLRYSTASAPYSFQPCSPLSKAYANMHEPPSTGNSTAKQGTMGTCEKGAGWSRGANAGAMAASMVAVGSVSGGAAPLPSRRGAQHAVGDRAERCCGGTAPCCVDNVDRRQRLAVPRRSSESRTGRQRPQAGSVGFMSKSLRPWEGDLRLMPFSLPFFSASLQVRRRNPEIRGRRTQYLG